MLNIQAQDLCDYELKVINKQKKKISSKTQKIAKEWYSSNTSQLKLPEKLKFSKIKVKTLEDKSELKKWSSIDSILCLNKDGNAIEKAIKKMEQLNLSVYDIRAYFNFENSSNKEIRSILYFQFDINRNLLKAVIREKEDSPYSEKYFR